MTAQHVAQAVAGSLHGPDLVLSGPVVTDSRQVTGGALFVALAGERTDGHDHVADAVARGAALCLVSRPVDAPHVLVADTVRALGDLAQAVLAAARAEGDLTVVAVTGSVGKTTTKDLLAQLLAPLGAVLAPVGSYNNEVGLPLTVLKLEPSTRVLVLEMGADAPGNLSYLTSIAPPDLAVVLAVGSAHLGRFGGVEAVAAAKAEILAGLRPGGTAVLNADDPRVAAMAGAVPGPVLTFGRGPDALVRAEGVAAGAATSFDLVLDGRPAGRVDLALVGEHHVANATAAAAVAHAMGMAPDRIVAGLTAARALSPHRMQVVHRNDGVTILDDSYNANPDSVRAALKALAAMAGPGQRTVAVLGEMLELGDASTAEHDAVGRLAVRLNIGLLLVVGAGARPILNGAHLEGSWGEEIAFAADPDQAESLLCERLAPGDLVLVKASNSTGLWRLADRLTAEAASA